MHSKATLSRMTPDLLIVGAGPTGCVVAERAAQLHGWKSVVIDRRPHIAGNCFDQYHSSGILIHRYGPHYFRTNDSDLVTYLSNFTKWIPSNYIVKSSVGGELLPFPINLTTLEKVFKRTLTAEEAQNLLGDLKIPISNPSNSEDYVLARVGLQLFRDFYEGYTEKQWGVHPRELPPEICGRIPIRMSRDERYVDHQYQMMPAKGYASLFERMLAHENIELRLNVDYSQFRNLVAPRIGTIYCGPIDEFFNFQLGKLDWRSLDFEFQEFDQPFKQPCVQINYPSVRVPYTRSVEFKHVTGQQHAKTVVALEYPRAAGEPYYPVSTARNEGLYARYEKLAREQSAANQAPVYFCGRQGTYRYMNMDECMLSAMKMVEKIESDFMRRTQCSN